MYVFADKFFNIALPRVRDFKGVSKNSFDGRGNYTMGIKEQLIFPEIDYDKIDKIKGMGYHVHHYGKDRRRSAGSPRTAGYAV